MSTYENRHYVNKINYKHMKTRFFSLPVLLLISMSCSTSTTDNACDTNECLKQKAYDKVIAVHDEVMPKLAYISELKGRIEERMNATQDSLAVADWQSLMVDLDAADEAMWVWMRQFNADLEETPVEEALAYLKSEQEKVDEVADKINTVIATAEDRLK